MTAASRAPSVASDHVPGGPIARYAAIGDGFSSPHDSGVPSWTQVLTAHLARAGSPLQHLNLAQRGATSDHVLKVQIPQALAFRPDLVTVVCGLNDVFKWWPNDFSRYGAHLKQILFSLSGRAPGAVVISATCPNNVQRLPLADGVRKHLASAVELLNEITRSICIRLQIPFVDFAEATTPTAPQAADIALSAWASHPLDVSRAFAELIEAQLPWPGSRTAAAAENPPVKSTSRGSSLAA
jgi:lysophospholipase L1-like esterase